MVTFPVTDFTRNLFLSPTDGTFLLHRTGHAKTSFSTVKLIGKLTLVEEITYNTSAWLLLVQTNDKREQVISPMLPKATGQQPRQNI